MNESDRPYPESALLVGAAQSVWDGSLAAVTIQISVSKKLKNVMKGYGIDPLESVFITDSDMRHIKRSHTGVEEQRGQIGIVPSDFGDLPAVLADFDGFEQSECDKLGNKRFLLTKAIGDKFYVVTVQRGRRKMEVKTMWKKPGASC